MAHSLFVYGTLMSPEVFQLVTGKHKTGSPSHAIGYQAYWVKGGDFPGMINSESSRTEGIIYHGLNDLEISRLDQYEDDFYKREIIQVYDPQTETWSDAWTYLVPSLNKNVLTNKVWDFEEFQKGYLSNYLKSLKRWLDE